MRNLAAIFVVLGLLGACRADETMTVASGGGKIEVSFSGEEMTGATRADLQTWVHNAADAVTAYYGRYPVASVRVMVRITQGRGIRHGWTIADPDPVIRIAVGRETTAADLMQDWRLTHEMVHLAFPSVEENHHWIEEGIATYVEPIARVQTGNLPAAQMWHDVVRDLPQGLPEAGDEGLDHTETWGRTYWGGALFCLLAEVQIRKQTHNQKGLEDALRGIVQAGGNLAEDWPLERALAAGDKATGTHVLTELYQHMKDKPMVPDLAKLWNELGIQRAGNGEISFSDSAPLAEARKAITAARR